MKRRVFSWILAGTLLFQSVNVEAAQLASYTGMEQRVAKQSVASQDFAAQETAWQEEQADSVEDREEASEKIGSTDGGETAASSGEGELWVEFPQDGEGLFQEGSFQIPERKRSGISLFSVGENQRAEDEQWKEWDAYICEQLRAKKTTIEIKDFQISTDQFSAWYYGVINEHPELYFVNSRISYMPMGNIVSAVMPTYEESYDDEAFAQAAREALSVVTEDMTDVQKAVALHDYLVVNCEYDYENYLNGTIPPESYTAYGPLVKGASVCQGYALAYKYLLQEVGIPCYMVKSSAMSHAWNMVELGGKLYQVDVTWDDPTWDSLGRVKHNNMFVSDKILEERQEHHDWTISYRGETVDFQALDTTYDEFFWTDVISPVILWGGSYYYIAKNKSINSIPVAASASGSLSWGDAVQVYGNIGTWYVWDKPSYFWTEAYSGLFLLGGRIYFNTPSQILSIKPDGTDIRTEFTADTTTGYLYGCAYRRGEVGYVLRTTPDHTGKEEVLTLELSGKIGVDKVVLDNTELRIFNGVQAQLTAEVSPKIATDQTILWSSSDEQVATVSGEGMVTAVGAGTCTITAAAGGCSAVCTVTVLDNDASLGKLKAPGFDPEGGSVEKGTEVVLTAEEGAVIYYTTDGTVPDMGSRQYKQPIVITQDVTIKAYAVQEHYESSDVAEASYQLKVLPAYEVTFDLQGHGQQIDPVTVEEGKKLSEPEAPTEEGYLFKGWYQEAACTIPWDFDADVITSRTTLYAKWIEANFDNPEYTFTTLDDRTVSSKADGRPKVLFFFRTNCWYCKQTNQDIRDHIDEFTGVDLYALELAGATKEEVSEFQAEYGCDGITYSYDKEGTNLSAMWAYCYEFESHSSVTTPVIVFIDAENRVRHLTTGMRSGSEILADVQKYCNALPQEGEKTYKITYVLDGGTNDSGNPDTYTSETETILLKGAVKEGYTFEGWYKDSEYKEEVKEIVKGSTGDITLYAKWSVQGIPTNGITINNIAKDESYAERIDLKSVGGAIANIKSKVYDGSPYTPAVKVTIQPDSGKNTKLALTEGTDYRVRYENCTNAGTATVVVEGNGNYTGTLKKEYTITPKAINKCKAVTGGLAVNDAPSKLSLNIYDGNRLLVKGKDYDFSAGKSLTAQKTNAAKVVVTGMGNYKGTLNAKFTVYEAGVTGVITPDNVKLSIASTPYTGKTIKVDDLLSVTVDGTVLEKNKQYSVAYKNNTNAGTAFVTITGKGGYAGKVVKSFTITPLSKQTLEIKDIPAKTYNGKVQTPAVTVKVGKKKLTKNKDYTLTYSNNLHTGKATVNITGKGNYAGTTGKITFDIKAQKISKASVKGNREEGLTLTYNKKTLREGIDYKLFYDETSVNKNKIKVTIKGFEDFAGSEVIKTVKDAVRDPAAKITPKSSNNKDGQNYDWNRWASTVKSYLTANPDGTLMRVEYTGSKVWAEIYQADGSCVDQREIKMELPIFGGFYAGKDNYFLIFGKKNPDEDDEAEVIRVVKYDKSWKRQDAVSLYGANTTIPFGYGSLRMAEYGGMLYVRTCHQMYKSSDGLNHQANLTFCVKTDEMRITDQFSKVMNASYGYVSHSFNQFIRVDGGKLVAVDHGDAYPRSVVLVQYLEDAGGETFSEGQVWWNEDGSYGMGNCINVNVLPIQGSNGANDTGVSVGGFEASGTAYLVAGNSVPQDDADSYDAFGKRNIFVTCTPKTALAQTATQAERESATTVRWITNYTEKDSVDVSTPQLVKLGDNEFLLLWTEDEKVKSVLLDGLGNPTTGIHSMKGALSDCQPIRTGDSVTWYYTDNSKPVFCSLRISDIQ